MTRGSGTRPGAELEKAISDHYTEQFAKRGSGPRETDIETPVPNKISDQHQD